MSASAELTSSANIGQKLLSFPYPLWGILAAAFAIILFSGFLPDWLTRIPETAYLPLAGILDDGFALVREDIMVVTRWFANILRMLLDTTGNLLYGRHRWPFIGPIPWAAIAVTAAVIGHYLGGWRMALLGGGTFVWIALIGQWKIAMQTLSVISVAVPYAFILGLTLGILAWKFPRFNRAMRPVLSVLQTLPFFTYLLPAVIFFVVGPTAAAVATIVYAIPPMILMTTLGLQKVSPEIVEAGKMSGCTRWQMLRYVYVPSARTQVLVGVNQVIMLSLAMVVLTAFIGMPGLGAKLLAMMNSFKLGRSFEIGISIVFIAVMLDRLSKAWVVKQPVHFERGTPFWKRHVHLLSAIGLFIGFVILAQYVQIADHIKRDQDFSKGKEIDGYIKAFVGSDIVTSVTGSIRWFLNTQVLIPFRDFLLWLPTTSFVLLITAFAYGLGGRKVGIIALLFFTYIAFSGWWDRSVITLYSVLAATFIAMIFSIPLAIWAAQSERTSKWILLVCDTAQTFPSFIYLIPVIMLFGVTDVAVVFAIIIFASVPLVRYTVEGLRSVPPEMVEAADMAGANRIQKLIHVQFPLALPTMAVGFNQAIMFAFFMVIIAAFIGTQDLGQELQRTLAGTELGKNFVLGMNVALMALTFDLTIMAWAEKRKKILGLAE